MDAIFFGLKCLPNTYNTLEPEGYLFLCPPEDFRAGHDGFRWPHQPAFWSFDPSGAVRLSAEDAKILGFPIIHTETLIHGRSWDKNVYEGLRRFNRAKGLDLDSREAAIHLGYPLYKLSNEASHRHMVSRISTSYYCVLIPRL